MWTTGYTTYGRGAHRVGRDAARAVADSMEHRTDERAVALLKGLDRRIGAETTMPVQIAEAALACVACGFGSRTRRTALLAGAQSTRRMRYYFSSLKTSESPDSDAPSARRRRRTINEENNQ